MTQLDDGHDLLHAQNKDKLYKERKLKFLEDRIKTLEKSVGSLNKAVGELIQTHMERNSNDR